MLIGQVVWRNCVCERATVPFSIAIEISRTTSDDKAEDGLLECDLLDMNWKDAAFSS